MMSALGGRLAAYRVAEDEAAFAAAVRRNVFRDGAGPEAAPELVARRLAGFRDALGAVAYPDLLEGRLP
jgi:cytochrome b pre-mRNA-processing protein 3